MSEPLLEFLKRVRACNQTHPFKPGIITTDHGTAWVCLENVPHFHEWIKGEGADISLWRAMDDRRIVGATLPISGSGTHYLLSHAGGDDAG